MNADYEIGQGSRIRQRTGISAYDVDGCIVITDESDSCYGLESIAQRIWRLLAEPTTVEEIIATLAEEYDVEQSRCEQDVAAFIKELNQAGLVEAAGASGRVGF